MAHALARILALLAIVVAVATGAGRAMAGETPVPHPPKGQGEHCVADTDFMRRNHMTMLLHERTETVREGVRGEKFSLAGCVSCHAVKGDDSKPVAFSDNRHFCRTCHSYAAVKIDCFECHASRPDERKKSASTTGSDRAVAALASRVREMKP